MLYEADVVEEEALRQAFPRLLPARVAYRGSWRQRPRRREGGVGAGAGDGGGGGVLRGECPYCSEPISVKT